MRANERTRTADLLITSELLYQLSYIGLVCAFFEAAQKLDPIRQESQRI